MSGAHPKVETPCQRCGATFLGSGWNPRPRWCPACRPLARRTKTKKYTWTPELDALLLERYDTTVRGRVAEIATALGWPAWVIKKRAQQLALSRPWAADRRDWTEAEVIFLTQWTGRRDSGWIAKRLGRTLTSTTVKQKRLALSRRVRVGYTKGDLCRCFGVDHHVISRWISLNWLPLATRETNRTTQQGGDPWCVTEADVVAFVRAHPECVDLRKVDQGWFFDVIVEASASGAAEAMPDGLTREWVSHVRTVIREMEPGETFSTAAVHSRVDLPAHQVRLALRALQQSKVIDRLWIRCGGRLADRRRSA